MSERRACRVLGQHRSTQRKPKVVAIDEAKLTADIICLAEQYGRYGYRRVTALLRREGWMVNAKRVERIWRREGFKIPQKQPKRGRLCSTTARASGSGRSIKAISGHTNSWRTKSMTAARLGC